MQSCQTMYAHSSVSFPIENSCSELSVGTFCESFSDPFDKNTYTHSAKETTFQSEPSNTNKQRSEVKTHIAYQVGHLLHTQQPLQALTEVDQAKQASSSCWGSPYFESDRQILHKRALKQSYHQNVVQHKIDQRKLRKRYIVRKLRTRRTQW